MQRGPTDGFEETGGTSPWKGRWTTEDRRPFVLAQVIFILSVFLGGFFLALLTTEGVNKALGPLPGWAYFSVVGAVVGIEFIVAIIWERQAPGSSGPRYSRIWMPRVMRQGFPSIASAIWGHRTEWTNPAERAHGRAASGTTLFIMPDAA
ncbi:MAG: hypothetical protein OEM59_04605 [Rhodospirillales bacterium]|nr:hypothetical protein [Rhodospirillales bacterium]